MTKKKVIIDLDGAMLTLKNRGQKVRKDVICEDMGVSVPTMAKWSKCAPPCVQVVYYWLSHAKTTFPKIMKLIEGQDKGLDFIFRFCNETGLTFEEVVKEV